tara:strand:+ start:116 stop:421 length:306 start_codon:yes stop_codon:yes gene_type:complete
MQSEIKDSKTAKALLKQGKWYSTPNDVMTILHSICISNTIDIRVTNEPNDVDYTVSVSNVDDAWKWLKWIDGTPARKVLYETEDGETIDFKDSAPYQYRFA